MSPAELEAKVSRASPWCGMMNGESAAIVRSVRASS